MTTSAPIFVWYRLIDDEGDPLNGAEVSAVAMFPDSMMFQLRDAILAKNRNKLSQLDANDLRLLSKYLS
jgi:rhamnogalacturonyl hydrolase YesR